MLRNSFHRIKNHWDWIAFLLLFSQFAHAQTVFTSSPTLSGTYDASYVYNITTSGINLRAIFLTSGVLPNGLILIDNGDGTAQLSGNLAETGSFTIQLTVQETADISMQDVQNFTIAIAKATASISLSNLNPTYDGTPKLVTATTIPPGLTVDITYDGGNTPPTNAGSYAIVATINELHYQGTASGTLIINKAPLLATADDQSRQYGQANPAFIITYLGFVSGDNVSSITVPTASTSATILSNVGVYAIVLAGGSAPNYILTLQSGTLAIKKAPLTAKADDQSRLYGAVDPTFTISYTGFLNGDNAALIIVPTATTTATVASSVGAYAINLTGGTSTNYTLTLQSGTLTINQAPLTAKADD
ncbi:MAG: MBG domain-containing protein, partial [Cyclobacteriaceae bacterium]